jgi:hypothetical protein
MISLFVFTQFDARPWRAKLLVRELHNFIHDVPCTGVGSTDVLCTGVDCMLDSLF